MFKIHIQDKSIFIKWMVIILVCLFFLSFSSIYIIKAIKTSEWYHLRQLEKAYHQEYVHINEADKIIYIGISSNGEEGPWQYFYEVPEFLFDDMNCEDFNEIEDPVVVDEILNYDWIMAVFKDGSKSIYHISPEEEIYWGTSFAVKCPSLLQWYQENKE